MALLEGPEQASGPRGARRMTEPWTARVLTLFPEMFPGPLGHSLTGRALADGLWRLEARNIRDVATDRHRSVDDTPAGGGAGMVLRADIAAAALDAAATGDPAWPVLYLSPRGAPLRPGARPRARRRARRHAALRPLRGDRRAGARGARRRGGEPRRLRPDRRRDRRYGLDRRHRSAYTPRPRERRVDGGGVASRPASWSFRTTPARPNGKVCEFPRFSSRGITDGSPSGDAPRRSG